jgi:N-acetylmuramoyl-L-alanine amidase
VPDSILLGAGARGEAVRDLQWRLGALGYGHAPDEPGTFAHGTTAAVRAFQHDRGLQVDGVVGRHTWASLVESGFSLGDRLLYFRQPMLRGDDVAELQRRLNSLGFDARRVDGIFGADTHRALTDFQRSSGLVTDGVCGPGTIVAFARVAVLADGSVAGARDRDELRHQPSGLVGRRVFVTTPPGLAVVGDAVVRGLGASRGAAVLDSSGDDESLLARAANAFRADLYVGIRSTVDAVAHCLYFETPGFRSEMGYEAATAIREAVAPVLGRELLVAGRAYPVLRETLMAAVVCEFAAEGDADALAAIVRHSGDLARAVVQGIRRAFEPLDAARPATGD